MKKLVFEVNKDGYIEEIHVIEEGQPTEYITNSPPDGFYRARWTGNEWIEDMSAEEIEALKNRPQIPSLEERIEAVEAAILTIMEVL